MIFDLKRKFNRAIVYSQSQKWKCFIIHSTGLFLWMLTQQKSVKYFLVKYCDNFKLCCLLEAQLQKQSKLVQGVTILKWNCYQKQYSREHLLIVYFNNRWLKVSIKMISKLVFFLKLVIRERTNMVSSFKQTTIT